MATTTKIDFFPMPTEETIMTEELQGSVRTMMKWFSPPVEVCGADDDFERAALLAALDKATHVGTWGSFPRTDDSPARKANPARREILVVAPHCRAMLTAFEHEGSSLVDVDVVVEDWPGIAMPDGGRLNGRRYRFWMNASSLRDLGKRLRRLPRVSPDAIFVGAAV